MAGARPTIPEVVQWKRLFGTNETGITLSDQIVLPDITNLSVLLSGDVADMGVAQLKRHFRQHHLRWDEHDPHVVDVVRNLADQVQQVRRLTGWDVRDVLWVIGCREHGTSLETEHLQDALQLVERLGGIVDDVSLVVEETEVVSQAFRSVPGDSSTPLASMVPGPWDDIVSAAISFASDAAFDQTVLSKRRPVSEALQGLRRAAG